MDFEHDPDGGTPIDGTPASSGTPQNHAKVEDNAPVLTTASTTIRDMYNQLAESHVEEMKPFILALSALNGIIAKLHDAGAPFDQTGVEVANFDKMNQNRLLSDGCDTPFCILSILDARYVVRLQKQGHIDILNQNLNKPHITLQLSDRSLWETRESAGKTMNYMPYDLTKEEDRVRLTDIIVETAAAAVARQEMRAYDIVPRSAATLYKSRLKFDNKP